MSWAGLEVELAGVRRAVENTNRDPAKIAAYVYDRQSAYTGANHPWVGAQLIEAAVAAVGADAGEPVVTMDAEPPHHRAETAIGGTYELQDGRSFWMDKTTVSEILRRIDSAGLQFEGSAIKESTGAICGYCLASRQPVEVGRPCELCGNEGDDA